MTFAHIFNFKLYLLVKDFSQCKQLNKFNYKCTLWNLSLKLGSVEFVDSLPFKDKKAHFLNNFLHGPTSSIIHSLELCFLSMCLLNFLSFSKSILAALNVHVLVSVPTSSLKMCFWDGGYMFLSHFRCFQLL